MPVLNISHRNRKGETSNRTVEVQRREPQRSAEASPPSPVTEVSVNGITIGAEAIHAEAQHHPADTPGEAIRSAARALAVRELLLQRAGELGIEATPETDGDGRRATDEDALIDALVEREVSTPRADEDACRRFYENNRERFSSETIYEARHILLAAPEDDAEARAEARATAETLIAQLTHAPAAFERLAQAYSACPSREQGGNLGQLTGGSTVPEFESALHDLAEGELASDPVSTHFGYHVIALDRIIPGQLLPFAEVEETIAAYLEASSWSRAVAQYISILAGAADVRGIDLSGADSPLVQ